MDFVLEMRRRIRIHMLTAIGGIVVALVAATACAAVIHIIAGDAAWGSMAAGVASLVAIALIPAIGFWSTWRNLRCPSCNGWVAFQVSQKYSAFGSLASSAP